MILETSEFRRGEEGREWEKGESERMERMKEGKEWENRQCFVWFILEKRKKCSWKNRCESKRERWRMDVDDDGKLNGASKHTRGQNTSSLPSFPPQSERTQRMEKRRNKRRKRKRTQEEGRGREHKKKKEEENTRRRKKVRGRTGEKERAETVKVTLFFLQPFLTPLKECRRFETKTKFLRLTWEKREKEWILVMIAFLPLLSHSLHPSLIPFVSVSYTWLHVSLSTSFQVITKGLSLSLSLLESLLVWSSWRHSSCVIFENRWIQLEKVSFYWNSNSQNMRRRKRSNSGIPKRRTWTRHNACLMRLKGERERVRESETDESKWWIILYRNWMTDHSYINYDSVHWQILLELYF